MDLPDSATSESIGLIHRLQRGYHANADKLQGKRFGQFVCNVLEIADNRLFYETDERKAFTLACLIATRDNLTDEDISTKTKLAL